MSSHSSVSSDLNDAFNNSLNLVLISILYQVGYCFCCILATSREARPIIEINYFKFTIRTDDAVTTVNRSTHQFRQSFRLMLQMLFIKQIMVRIAITLLIIKLKHPVISRIEESEEANTPHAVKLHQVALHVSADHHRCDAAFHKTYLRLLQFHIISGIDHIIRRL